MIIFRQKKDGSSEPFYQKHLAEYDYIQTEKGWLGRAILPETPNKQEEPI